MNGSWGFYGFSFIYSVLPNSNRYLVFSFHWRFRALGHGVADTRVGCDSFSSGAVFVVDAISRKHNWYDYN